MKKEELFAKTCDELRTIAKKYAVVGRSKMTKAQLVEAIVNATAQESEANEQRFGTPKVEYIKNAEKGTIVAFKLPNGKVKSGKLVERSIKREKVKVETTYGKQFVVSFSDIIWVRTGSRWPKGVFKLLKGNGGNNEVSKQEEAK